MGVGNCLINFLKFNNINQIICLGVKLRASVKAVMPQRQGEIIRWVRPTTIRGKENSSQKINVVLTNDYYFTDHKMTNIAVSCPFEDCRFEIVI